MLRMEQIAAIKQMSQSESISTIASALNIDWKTARKYAGMDDFNVSVESFRAHRRGSKLDPYKSEIDRIMDEEEQGRLPVLCQTKMAKNFIVFPEKFQITGLVTEETLFSS